MALTNGSASPRRKPAIGGRLSWLARAGLMALDAMTLAAAFALATLLRFYNPWWPYYHTFSPFFYLHLGLLALPCWLLLFAAFRLYDPEELFGGVREYARIANACTLGTIGLMAYDFLAWEETEQVSRAWLLLVWGLSIFCTTGMRFALRRVVYALRRRGHFLRPALVVGANAEGQAIARQLRDAPSASGVRVLGLVDDLPSEGTPDLPRLGGLSDLPDLIRRYNVRELIVAGTALPREKLLELFCRYGQNDDRLTIRLSSGLFEILTTGMRLRKVGYIPLVTLDHTRITGVDAFLKRSLDLAGSLLALLLTAPLLLLIAILVKATSPGPIFYRRWVLGQAGRPFDALKFRTMYTNGTEILARYPHLQAELERNGKIKNDPRITPLGRLLRRYSLDELPQFFNVLIGQMSLVGPRMIAPEELARYGKWQHNLFTVKPGLTGLWQVSGRSDLSYEDRVRLDMHYIRNYTIWLDLQILFQTIPVVLKGKGAY